MSILLTRGLGFIGSHVASSLLKNGQDPVLLGNACNGQVSVYQHLECLSGQEILFYERGVRNPSILGNIFSKCSISTAMHFASLKSIGQLIKHLWLYFNKNVPSVKAHVILGSLPKDEACPVRQINSYGQIKLQDLQKLALEN